MVKASARSGKSISFHPQRQSSAILLTDSNDKAKDAGARDYVWDQVCLPCSQQRFSKLGVTVIGCLWHAMNSQRSIATGRVAAGGDSSPRTVISIQIVVAELIERLMGASLLDSATIVSRLKSVAKEWQ